MNIYPAIDLKSGQCVRLYQGRYDLITIYENDPLAMAKHFEEAGAAWVHIVDLDGARQGHSNNLDAIIKIAQETDLKIQMGGGVRSHEQVISLLELGIDRVILGSLAVSNCIAVKKWLNELGPDQLVLALDVRFDAMNMPKLALQAWQSSSEITLWQLLEEYSDVGLKHILCTDVSRDGALNGPNINLYQECMHRYPALALQASGGVSSLADLKQLSAIPVSGVVIGKAFYENKFTYQAAQNEVALC